MDKVKVHCGSAYVRGTARRYPYFIGQLFSPKPRMDGVITYRATGIIVGPFRSFEKTKREALKLAQDNKATFIEGYGSLHGTPMPNNLEKI